MNKGYREVEDPLDTSEMRKFLEITKEMARMMNHKEFYKIMSIYNDITIRLLKK